MFYYQTCVKRVFSGFIGPNSRSTGAQAFASELCQLLWSCLGSTFVCRIFRLVQIEEFETKSIQNIIPFQSVQDFFTKSWGVGWLGFQTRDGLPDLANGLDGLEDSSTNSFDFKFDNRKMNYRKRFVRDIFFDIVFLLLAFSEYLLRLSHLPGALVLHRQFQHPKPENCKN